MTKSFFATLLLLIVAISVHAADKITPGYAEVGKTIYVSGPLKGWSGHLLAAVNRVVQTPGQPESLKFDTLVFVNAAGDRWENVGGGVYFADALKALGVSKTIVSGRCDLYCARIFAGAPNRFFAKDGQVVFQVPLVFETKKMERRYPHTQLAFFEKVTPAFAKDNKEALQRGFTKPSDETGGLFVGYDSVKYCDSLKTGQCESYPQLDAHRMGLTTSPEPAAVELPEGFGVQLPSGGL